VKKMENSLWLDAEQVARDCGSPKSSNIVMLGAASGQIGLNLSSLQKGIVAVFGKKGRDIVEVNLRALEAGRSFSR